MSKKKYSATITLYSYYFKSAEVEIDENLIKGMTPEEIKKGILDGSIPYDEYADQETSLEGFEPEKDEDKSRFDIYDSNGSVLGGLL